MTGRTALAAAALLAVLGAAAVVTNQRATPGDVTAVVAGDAGSGGPASAADPAAPARALPVGVPAPGIRASGWLNSDPLDAADLRGKVVLYEFWTFGCINCRHVLPHVKAWYDRYAADGLVVVGVHTPEFGYEADPSAVADFVRENGIRYPVALDPDGTVWQAFGNRYWPQFSLHDRDGRRRLVKIGEGGYDTTEDAIRALLGVDPRSRRAAVA